MSNHPVVSSDQWVVSRKELLQKEKELSRLRDELTQMRRDLPWEQVTKSYTFDGPDGSTSLNDLFGDCSQLIVYHFMYGPGWDHPCAICSMCADHYDPLVVHLRQRDVSLVTVSLAPLSDIESYKKRMGWSFPWVSSLNSDFNRDFHVSFTQQELDSGSAYYNYRRGPQFPSTEGPGISSFYRDDDGTLYHTYSSFARGLENFLGVYNFLDIVPKGRDEAGLPFSMAWVKPKDQYDQKPKVVDIQLKST